MSVIKANCTDQQLKLVETPVIASGGVNEVKVEFEFCEKWDGFAKTAVFYQDEADVYYALLDSNDICVVPWEVCYADGTFYLGVFGEKGNVRRTSTIVRYKVRKGFVTEVMMPSDPSPEIYDQILAEIARVRENNSTFIADANSKLDEANRKMDEASQKLDEAKEENEKFIEQANQTLTNALKHNIANIEKTGTDGLVDTYTITFLDGSTKTYTVTNGKEGYTPKKNIDYFDGEPGKDGVSVTHVWDGTKLHITSSSGTSYADLKGERGPKGESGIVSPVAGFFSLTVDDNGNLYAFCEDSAVPNFEYDPETGNLYVVQEES